MEDSAMCREAPSHRISSAGKSSCPKVWLYFRVAHLPQLSAVGVERPCPLTPTAVQGPQLFEFPVELAEPSVETPLHLTCFFCPI